MPAVFQRLWHDSQTIFRAGRLWNVYVSEKHQGKTAHSTQTATTQEILMPRTQSKLKYVRGCCLHNIYLCSTPPLQYFWVCRTCE
jgi:hypothetical protein